MDAKKYARSEWSVDIHVKAAVIIMTILDKMIQLGIIQLSVWSIVQKKNNVDISANGHAFNAKMDSLKDISKTVKKLLQKL